jgi:hypothetical protein
MIESDNTIRWMSLACWMTKATNTHTRSEYVIVIAFPRQLRLGQRAAVSRHTHITAVVSVGVHLEQRENIWAELHEI